MSPTLIREAGYHIIMYYNDHVPAHVHVKRAGNEARVQIDPVKLMDNWGYDPGEVKSVLRLVQKHQVLLLETWKKFYPENDGESDE